MFTVETVGLVQLAHDGLELAERVKPASPELAEAIVNACETVLSAAVYILRHPKASVPIDIAHAINFVNDALTSASA